MAIAPVLLDSVLVNQSKEQIERGARQPAAHQGDFLFAECGPSLWTQPRITEHLSSTSRAGCWRAGAGSGPLSSQARNEACPVSPTRDGKRSFPPGSIIRRMRW